MFFIKIYIKLQASIQYFPEDVQNDLMAIAEWLSLNDHDEFMNIYAAVRGSLMKKSLDLVQLEVYKFKLFWVQEL